MKGSPMQINLVWEVDVPEGEIQSPYELGQGAVPLMIEAFEEKLGKPFTVHSIIVDVDFTKAHPIRVNVRGTLADQQWGQVWSPVADGDLTSFLAIQDNGETVAVFVNDEQGYAEEAFPDGVRACKLTPQPQGIEAGNQ